jgi:hypothetical protein
MTDKPSGAVNRAREAGLRLFCGRKCSGLARRKHKTKAQKKEEKRLYDIEYRKQNLATIKAKKHAYFVRTYDPAKAAVERKRRAKKHVEYCRRPEYRAWKREYDRRYRASEYGPLADAYLLAIDLNREIKSRSTNYEIRRQNQTWGKRQARAAEEGSRASRDRDRPAQGIVSA